MFYIAYSMDQSHRKLPAWCATGAKTIKSAQQVATRARGHYRAFAWVGEKQEDGAIKILCERDHRGWTNFQTDASQPASDMPA